MASRSDVETHEDRYRRFERAIDRALVAIQSTPSEALAELVAPWFPTVGLATAGRIIERYREIDAWPARATLEPEHVGRWQQILVRGGLMPRAIDWRPLLGFVNSPPEPPGP
jgi:ABC-type nitrate/sulfonate/bicarbonate transport system substrate-binding protein